MAVEIRVPALGESVTEATVSKWLVKAGDTVAVDQPLCELETDKVTVEVPAPASGAIESIAYRPKTFALKLIQSSIWRGIAVIFVQHVHQIGVALDDLAHHVVRRRHHVTAFKLPPAAGQGSG